MCPWHHYVTKKIKLNIKMSYPFAWRPRKILLDWTIVHWITFRSLSPRRQRDRRRSAGISSSRSSICGHKSTLQEWFVTDNSCRKTPERRWIMRTFAIGTNLIEKCQFDMIKLRGYRIDEDLKRSNICINYYVLIWMNYSQICVIFLYRD